MSGTKRTHLMAVRDEIKSLLKPWSNESTEQRGRKLEALARSDPESFQEMEESIHGCTLLVKLIRNAFGLETIKAVYEACAGEGMEPRRGRAIFHVASINRFDVVCFLARAKPETLKSRDSYDNTPLHELLMNLTHEEYDGEVKETLELLVGLCPERVLH